MSLPTALTEMVRIEHPIVLAPKGGVAGGVLAAAVSEGGGLGLIGAGRGELEWLHRECALARAATSKPWGIGFLTWAIGPRTVEAAIEQSPAAIMLSFGDPTPYTETARAAGIPLMVQVTTMDEARRALDAGANVVVAQGAEAGGHGGGRADVAGSTPVLAAGGIADGRGLAAALMLGAAGAMIGTRFAATPEALLDAEESKAITAAEAAERGNREYLPIWAGEAVDLITELDSASALVARIAQDAEHTITATGNTVRAPRVRHCHER